ncbi:hypothetical protein BDZ94DRAFT_1196210 [Collybia nuda]|uniref:TIR domain-containing protein n=1 Tax=Collybia nuda TaxID=64659 RepID=A0A9P6CD34_9AGAR|nr:hypothetical protein BDZ94DRAFT_1196210 [Collybia nuda]
MAASYEGPKGPNREQCVQVTQATFDCIIFYRWYTRDGKRERGRAMARLIAAILEALGVTVWLDQHQMSRDTTRDQVLDGISKAFQRVRYVIILAAPGDWDRFVNRDDIHHWEWEISLKSGKPVWVLQHEVCPEIGLRPVDLADELSFFSNLLADLVLKRSIQIRTITTLVEDLYVTLVDICSITQRKGRITVQPNDVL